MGVYTNAVQQLYVAYFGRPADAAGLAYWEGVVTKANGSTAAVSAAFAASAEYKAAYAGLDAQHVVAQVYQNLFGHLPDLPGLNYWTAALAAGQMTIDNVVTEVAKGAQGNADGQILSNKVAAATAFTAALDTTAEVLAYSGDAANAAAKNFIAGVTDDASLKAAIDPTALNNTVSTIVDAGNQGKTFALTAGQDTIIGTAGNDVINVTAFNASTGAAQTNLSSFDSIDGGAGKDTLNLDLTGGKNTITGTIKNVEIINVTGATSTVDASAFQGATNVNLDATSFSTVSNLASTTTAGFTGTTSNIIVGAAGTSASIALSNVAEGSTLTVLGTSLNSVTVSGTRADTDNSGSVAAQNLTVTVGKNAQTLTLNTNQKTALTIDDTTNGSTKFVTTLDASASTGGITIVGDADLANVKTGTGKDTVTIAAATVAATSTAAAVNATVSTGDGDDTINVNSTGTGVTTVDAGAGNDKITVNKVTDAGLVIHGGDGNDTVIINSGTLQTSDVIDGGAGTDAIQFAGAGSRGAVDYIVFNKLVSNFETIKFSGVEGDLDASKLAATYTTIDLGSGSAVHNVGTQAIVANGDLTVDASGYDNTTTPVTYAGTVALTEKATGDLTVSADVVNLTVKAGTVDTTATLLGDVRTANVTLTNANNGATDSTAADTFAKFNLDTANGDAALKTLTLTGNGSATVHNADATALVTVDASGLGGTLALGTHAGDVTGGLIYVSDNTKAETIKLGSGIDAITLNASTYGKMDTVTGLNLVANSDASDVTAASDVLKVTAVDGPAVKFTTTLTDLDLALTAAATSTKGDNLVFQLGGDTYIYHDAAGAGHDQIDATDTVVKITGAVDLDTLILSLGHTV